MHTDEYAISLSRELNSCRKIVQKIRKTLRKFEEKHGMTTEEFIQKQSSGNLTTSERDASAWLKEYNALKRWEERAREIERLYHEMRF
ncbi:MAG: hypothetical protein AB1553_02895 [Nitrospirota bacterium]